MPRSKTGTTDISEKIEEIARMSNMDTIENAIFPSFEGIIYSCAPIMSTIDWVNVTETIGPSQTPS